MRPSIERRRWLGYLHEAWARGSEARQHVPFESVPWEELLPQPLGDVRQTLGLRPLADPAMNSGGWTDESFFTRTFLASNVDPQSVQGVKAAVEAGVPLKELMRADADTRGRVEKLALEGAAAEVLVSALAPKNAAASSGVAAAV
jgi:hypothetical protein